MSKRKWNEARQKPFEVAIETSRRAQHSPCADQLKGHKRMLAQSCSKCWTAEAISCRFLLVRHSRSQLRSPKIATLLICAAISGENESSALLSELQRLPSVSLSKKPRRKSISLPSSSISYDAVAGPSNHPRLDEEFPRGIGLQSMPRNPVDFICNSCALCLSFLTPAGDQG